MRTAADDERRDAMLTKLDLEGEESDQYSENYPSQTNVWDAELDAVEASVAALEEKLVRTYDGEHD